MSDAPSIEDIEEAAQQRVLQYDRAGDGHYDTVSAFIKSLRGNDPDAALYWLATMVAAGEDPRFICRRLIISASEDVGNADPHALAGRDVGGVAGGGLGRPAGGAVRAGPGDGLHRRCAQVEPRRAPPTGRRWTTSCATAHCRCRTTCAAPPGASSATSARQGLRLPARLHGRGRRAAVPARSSSPAGRYYEPSDHGYEKIIGERMDMRRQAREAAAEAGGPTRDPTAVPKSNAMKVAGKVMAQREERKRRDLAARQKKEASSGD